MPKTDTPNDAMTVDTGLVRELAALLKETDLSEIEVADGERRIRVVRQLQAAMAPVAMAAPPQPVAVVAAASAPAADADMAAHPGVVPSPMVGTVYLSPEPDQPAFVSIGQAVSAGQTLLIIEAMKVMNPIAAPRAGTVRQILVRNEQPVEYDQPLLVIE